jgi:hypothetical protein
MKDCMHEWSTEANADNICIWCNTDYHTTAEYQVTLKEMN